MSEDRRQLAWYKRPFERLNRRLASYREQNLSVWLVIASHIFAAPFALNAGGGGGTRV
ncbi:MAG: hypothetical protein LBU73_00305 [Helicobacteraceae bacterium]|jgi:hypothetical protein|nr:hypothetical protein [Helicobacteraceae bacterium]